MKTVESAADQSTESQATDLPRTKSAATKSTTPAADLPETESAALQQTKSIAANLPQIESTPTHPSHPSDTDKGKDQTRTSSDPLSSTQQTSQPIIDKVTGKHSGEEADEGLSGLLLMAPLYFQSTLSSHQEALESSQQENPPIFGAQVLQALYHIFQALTDSQKAYDRIAIELDFLNSTFRRESRGIPMRLSNLETQVSRNRNLTSDFLEFKNVFLAQAKTTEAKLQNQLHLIEINLQNKQIAALEAVHGIKLELAEQQKMLTRMNRRDEMIMEKLDQVLDKRHRSQTLIDILNDEYDDVKNEKKGSSQRNLPSVKTMDHLEAEIADFWASQKFAEELEVEAKIRIAAKLSAQYDQQYEQQHRLTDVDRWMIQREKEEEANKQNTRSTYFKTLWSSHALFKGLTSTDAWKLFCNWEREGKLPIQIQHMNEISRYRKSDLSRPGIWWLGGQEAEEKLRQKEGEKDKTNKIEDISIRDPEDNLSA